MTAQIPYRFREAAFRRYESTIAQAVALGGVKFTPKRSCETDSCRLRDAMKSLATFQWKPTIVNMPKFLSMRHNNQLKVYVTDAGEICVGALKTEVEFAYTYCDTHVKCVELLRQHDNGEKTTPTYMVGMPFQIVLDLSQQFDNVGITQGGDGVVVIL